MLGCFSRLRRPTGSPPPEPMPASDEPSTSASAAASPSAGSTSPCSSSSSSARRIIKNAGGGSSSSVSPRDGAVRENPSTAQRSESGLSSAIASRRFFLSSPGRSNSIVDSSAHWDVAGVGEAGVAVPAYSPDPHADFLRSMEEMAAALRLDARRRGDRARLLHELLLCYLALNDRSTHKYVVSAFTDLLLRLTATATNLEEDEHHN